LVVRGLLNALDIEDYNYYLGPDARGESVEYLEKYYNDENLIEASANFQEKVQLGLLSLSSTLSME
jgi:hypothetical protein